MMMHELWKTISGFHGYEVSNQGRVKSKQRIILRSNGRPHTVQERILKQHLSRGYWSVGLAVTGTGNICRVRVHKLVMAAFVGPPPKDHEVLHGPKGKLNNCRVNLSYGTKRQNQMDTYRDHTTANARPIKSSKGREFASISQAARALKVTPQAVWRALKYGGICRGLNWSYV